MSADNKAVREAFVAYMATVGVTGVVWTAELGPMGTRHHKSTLLSVAWMDFAAGYAAAIAAEREACEKAVLDAGGDNADYHAAAIRARGAS